MPISVKSDVIILNEDVIVIDSDPGVEAEHDEYPNSVVIAVGIGSDSNSNVDLYYMSAHDYEMFNKFDEPYRYYF